jgi:hypothetical protein
MHFLSSGFASTGQREVCDKSVTKRPDDESYLKENGQKVTKPIMYGNLFLLSRANFAHRASSRSV